MALDYFSEFNGIVRPLQQLPVRYAVVGGFAVAIHGSVRATEDVDFLVHPDDVAAFGTMLKELGYLQKREAWTFSNSQLTLHRYLKCEPGEEDYYVVDVLAANTPEHQSMIQRAKTENWSDGLLKVLQKKDLIDMKKQRGSHSDLADIEFLEKRDAAEDDKSRKGDSQAQ